MFKLKKLFVEYMPKGHNNSTKASSSTSNSRIFKRPKFNLADLDTEDSSDVSTKSKLDLYLEESRLNRDAELNILDFWGKNEIKYGELSYMARDILSVPLTTVALESSFSIGGRILNKWRSSCLPKNVENALVVKWNGLQRDEFGGLATTRRSITVIECLLCDYAIESDAQFLLGSHSHMKKLILYFYLSAAMSYLRKERNERLHNHDVLCTDQSKSVIQYIAQSVYAFLLTLKRRFVLKEAFVRVALAISGVADRTTAHNLFKALAGGKEGISYNVWSIYVNELLILVSETSILAAKELIRSLTHGERQPKIPVPASLVTGTCARFISISVTY
ncbi:hypothetical protein POM88_020938 [Heracleum sosnowskyi]|uniref:HAT C-terminal dimerisation domain-containing protein n=1 Tax=Heracleum sosnowskyi TaxID=360622 RepID=A0AAD8IF00_9APIA|nr:hypothetical protein POM88_020938 [Heracleum sosnowskyi]